MLSVGYVRVTGFGVWSSVQLRNSLICGFAPSAFRTTFSVAASVTLLKHPEKFRAPAIAS
jgi:hypothetical protein